MSATSSSAADYEGPLFKLLAQRRLPASTPPTAPTSLVCSVIFFRHGARGPAWISDLLPPVEWDRKQLVGSEDLAVPAFAPPFSYRTQPVADITVLQGPPGQAKGVLAGGIKAGELTRRGAAQMKALGGFLRRRYTEVRSAWPASAISSSSSRSSTLQAAHCPNANNASANHEHESEAARNAAAVALPSFLDTVGPESLFCRSTYFARALDSLLAVVTLLLDLPVTASKELANLALVVEVRDPSDEFLFINQTVTPSWEQVRRDGLHYAERLETVKRDSMALLQRIRRYYFEDGSSREQLLQAGELDALRAKLDQLEGDTRLLSNIHLFDEVSCRVEHGIRQWRSRREGPLADADFQWRLERTALTCLLYEIFGPNVSNEADLQKALQRCVGHPVCLARRFLMRAASAFRVHRTSSNGNHSPGDDSFDEESSFAVHWWGASGSPRLALIGAHDTTILPLIIAFGMFDYRWPTYASSFAFELHRLDGGASDSLFVRLFYYWPRVVNSSSDADPDIQIECVTERCFSLDDFLRIIEFFHDSESLVQ